MGTKVVSKQPTQPGRWTVWGGGEDNTPRRAMSSDGFDLVYHFPGGIGAKVQFLLLYNFFWLTHYQDKMTSVLIEYGNALKLKVKPTADKYHRNSPNSYKKKPGEISGVVHLVRCWHGIGRPVCLLFVIWRTY